MSATHAFLIAAGAMYALVVFVLTVEAAEHLRKVGGRRG